MPAGAHRPGIDASWEMMPEVAPKISWKSWRRGTGAIGARSHRIRKRTRRPKPAEASREAIYAALDAQRGGLA